MEQSSSVAASVLNHKKTSTLGGWFKQSYNLWLVLPWVLVILGLFIWQFWLG